MNNDYEFYERRMSLYDDEMNLYENRCCCSNQCGSCCSCPPVNNCCIGPTGPQGLPGTPGMPCLLYTSGASGYGCEFSRPPFEAFLPILKDDSFRFIEEEPLPKGYNPGELLF